MRAIMQRAWNEPAVCIGLLASLVLLVLQLIGDDKFTADTVISICAPLLAALGIRQTVSPALSLSTQPQGVPMTEVPQETPVPEPDDAPGTPAPEPEPEPVPAEPAEPAA